jgi:hypothetical protein
MTTIFYFKSATTQAYSGSSISYVASFNLADIATKLGLTAGSIAGAMAEENMGYDAIDRLSDAYANSGFDSTEFGNMASQIGVAATFALFADRITFSSPRTNAEWHALYQAAMTPGQFNSNPNPLAKAYNPIYYDVGPANFRIITAINLLNLASQSDVITLGLTNYKTDFASLARRMR